MDQQVAVVLHSMILLVRGRTLGALADEHAFLTKLRVGDVNAWTKS